jgi:uncharacterized protein YcfL
MSPTFRRTVLALTLFAGLLAGCGGGVNVAQFDAKAKTFSIGPINNGSLQSDCEIVTGKALYQEQLMQCSIELQSRTSSSQKVYYTWRWMDSDGFSLAEEPWHFLPLMGNERKMVTGTASAPRAVKAEFLLRERSEDDHEN